MSVLLRLAVPFFFLPFHSLAFSLFCTADISQQVKVHFTQWSEGAPTPWGAAKTSTTPSGLGPVAQPSCLSLSPLPGGSRRHLLSLGLQGQRCLCAQQTCKCHLHCHQPSHRPWGTGNAKLPGYQNAEGIQGCIAQTCLTCLLRSVQLTEEQRQSMLSYTCIFNLWLTSVFIPSQTF